ncbi:DUF2795 domain-containing protein [Rubrobacter tropicus]|uniref:DUF2795 domain-containing protein n=1 Tax=Rubrobacter tropicus TaxID=2653851 RepID=A0A6G8QAN5_9ACTN|nr:DUF2795 domain-containing protein [Rubrobacter tropicus]QIN83545.1 DUF2795 domain-containing protein [Rubrobacter tropicus]
MLEASVDFDPNDVPQYLEGVEYPASKEDLISAAEGNGAPGELVERIGTLGQPTFDSADEVVAELEASPTSG